MFRGACAVVLLLALVSYSCAASEWRLLGTFKVKAPAFLNLVSFKEGEEHGLSITSFSGNPLSKDSVMFVPSIDKSLSNLPSVTPATVSKSITWPNEATAVPFSVFNKRALVVCGGFLVPGKSTGAINLFAVNDDGSFSAPFQLSTDRKGYFYHRVIWRDVDGDGDFDVVTARATKPIFGTAGGELLWYENPGNALAFSQKWAAHVLVSGPDVFVEMVDLDNDGVEELLACQFFTKQFSVFWAAQGGWSKTTPETIGTRMVDDSIGAVFDLAVVDANLDGQLDVVVTNHEGDQNKSAVFVYEIPKDFKTGIWKRHTIASGFVTTQGGPGAGSPGSAIPFHPQVNATSKPSFLLAGDGTQEAYLIEPTSEDKEEWGYNTNVVLNAQCTVGKIAVGDVNGDGWVEFFVPGYDKNFVNAYTFAPN